VVTATVVAREQAVEVSPHVAVWQVAVVSLWQAVEEAGPLAHVVLDDDEVSFDEDETLQKRLRQLFGAGPAMPDEEVATMAAADSEATDRWPMEEATTKRAAEERAIEEAVVNAAAAEEVAGNTVDEVVGAAGGSPAPARRQQWPGTRGQRL
jgi:hypothetical protein